MSSSSALPARGSKDFVFAFGVATVLSILLIPIPPFILDLALALSLSLSILILMVALWIERPLDFSAFPLVLLVVTMLRLALNVATTRLILSHGHEGLHAAGGMVGGFANLVMGGDFVIGLVVFVILLTVNFIVISKGAMRIAEVGARFALDAVPGKQMAIDADLSTGLIDEKEARRRRQELEEESAFFGSMDGASKFVRGDAIAGLVITFVNSFGGIIIGVTRHGMDVASAADTFTKLTVGDGLVTQIPALIVSLAAGLLVSKGANRGTVESSIVKQLAAYPRALSVSSVMLGVMALVPGLPFLPFAILSLGLMTIVIVTNSAQLKLASDEAAAKLAASRQMEESAKSSPKEVLRMAEIELSLGRQLSSLFATSQGELASRVMKMRKRFASQYGFVVPEIKLSDDLQLGPKDYAIKIHGTIVSKYELRPKEVLVVLGDKEAPSLPGDSVREPAFGLEAMWFPEMFSTELKHLGLNPFEPMSVMLTHLSEVVRNNLAQLLSYRDLRIITEGLDPEYRKLLDEIVPGVMSFSTLQGVLKLLLAERVSVRNLNLILESVAEIAPQTRKPEIIAEHVRMRLAQQICGDLSEDSRLRVIRLGHVWDSIFLQALKRDGRGEVVEFDIDPENLEKFALDATKQIKPMLENGKTFVLATAPEARPYVRMIIDRVFPNLPVLSHLEVSRAGQIDLIGAMS
jgi:flagellar biosynthesis protein FlhA